MGALAHNLTMPLSARIEEEIQRLQPVDLRVAALILIPAGTGVPLDFRVAFVTRRFCEITGYEEREIAGRITDWLEGPETDPEALADVRAAVAAASPAELDLLSYAKAGTAFWSRLQMQPIKRRDGHVEGFAVYLTPAAKSRAGYLSEIGQQAEHARTDQQGGDD